MTENTDASELTKPKRTCATTREMHLRRAGELRVWLHETAGKDQERADRYGVTPFSKRVLRRQAKLMRSRAASLRWLIERERERNLLPILEPVEQKPFVLTED